MSAPTSTKRGSRAEMPGTSMDEDEAEDADL